MKTGFALNAGWILKAPLKDAGNVAAGESRLGPAYCTKEIALLVEYLHFAVL